MAKKKKIPLIIKVDLTKVLNQNMKVLNKNINFITKKICRTSLITLNMPMEVCPSTTKAAMLVKKSIKEIRSLPTCKTQV